MTCYCLPIGQMETAVDGEGGDLKIFGESFTSTDFE